MARPYQHLRRAEIADLLRANQAERDRIQGVVDRLEAELENVTGTDIDSIKRTIQLNQQITADTREITALLGKVQECNLELHIRDDPGLVTEFGPGAD